eukprot:1919509-Rhodomonas_salina.1
MGPRSESNGGGDGGGTGRVARGDSEAKALEGLRVTVILVQGFFPSILPLPARQNSRRSSLLPVVGEGETGT